MSFVPELFIIALSSDPQVYTIELGCKLVLNKVYRLAFRLPSGVTVPDISYTSASLHLVSNNDPTTVYTVSTFSPSTDDPHGIIEAVLDLSDPWFVEIFTEEAETVRVHATLISNEGTLLSGYITLDAADAEQTTPDRPDCGGIAGLIKAIRFDTEAQFSEWLNGTYARPDGIVPTDMFYGQFVHTQNEGTYVLTTPMDQSPGLAKNFTKIKTPFPMDGWAKVLAPYGSGGFAVYAQNFLDESHTTKYGIEGITKSFNGKTARYTFDKTDEGVVRFSDLSEAVKDIEISAGDTNALASRVQALERKVDGLDTTTVTGGPGIAVNNGVVSLKKDLASALQSIDPIQQTDTLSKIIDVLNVLINASK